MYHPQLYTFVKVVECQSFSKAADRLFLSRVSVMRQINALEDRIGVPLLVRSSSGIRLTPAGESLYQDAVYLLQLSEDAVQKARNIGASTKHTLRVGSSILNPCQPLISLWEEIRDECPGLRLKVIPYSDDQQDVLNQMASLGTAFDLVMAINDSSAWGAVTDFLPVRREIIQCAVPISHPLAVRESLEVSDFRGQEVMMVSGEDSPGNARARRILTEACPDVHILEVGNYYDVDVFHSCVERNCLLLSFSMWSDVHPSLVTIPIRWDCSVPYGIMYPKHPTREVRIFIDHIREYLG